MSGDSAELNVSASIRALVEQTVDQRVRSLEEAVKNLGSKSLSIDEATQKAISEQVLISNKTWLTRKDVAAYLQVSERSIAEWSARPVGDNPFPVSYAGGEPRYKRAAVDEWLGKEYQRQRLKLAG